jgi:hypothetical protein
VGAVFYTDRAYEVELLTHEILAERLDKAAPFGEVFCCSVAEAAVAVETALGRLGLLESARKAIAAEARDGEARWPNAGDLGAVL